MRQMYFLIPLIFFKEANAQAGFQLAPPLLKYTSIFFTESATAEIRFEQPGTTVHYTLNNEEPTEHDRVYVNTLVLKNKFTTLKAKAFGKDFLPSETVGVTFIRDGNKIKTIDCTKADPAYPASGAQSLTDNRGGIDQKDSNTWLGYSCDTVTVNMEMARSKPVKQVLINFLQNEDNWIFLPEQILVYGFDRRTDSFRLVGQEVIASDKGTPGSRCTYRLISTNKDFATDKLLIHIVVKKTIPEWHAAKGQHAWMFVDEIKIY